MKAKYSLGLLTAIFLTAGLALAQQQPTPPPAPPDEPLEQNFSFFVQGGGFLGVYGEDITRENMGHYNLREPRGVGITKVVNDSPAQKAGLRQNDVILRLDGDNVTSVRKLNRLVSEIAPDHTVRITISRSGSEQELTATIGKRSNTSTVQDLFKQDPKIWKWERPPAGSGDLADNNGDLTFFFGNTRRIGISTMELTKQLADYFGITGGKGVLVTSVIDDGPAAKAGVRAGDVITAIDGEEVDSPGDVARVINRKKEGDVTLTIIRNKSQQTIRVTPREGGGFSGTMGRPTVGRRIVIPRIEIPTPEIDISMPSIQFPSIPPVNIQMPRIRVMPRIRTVNGPI